MEEESSHISSTEDVDIEALPSFSALMAAVAAAAATKVHPPLASSTGLVDLVTADDEEESSSARAGYGQKINGGFDDSGACIVRMDAEFARSGRVSDSTLAACAPRPCADFDMVRAHYQTRFHEVTCASPTRWQCAQCRRFYCAAHQAHWPCLL